MEKSDLAKLLAALGHDTRLGIVKLLLQGNGGLVAGEIAAQLDKKKSTLSSHLAILVAAELIFAQRVGRNIHYQINRAKFEMVPVKLTQNLKRTPVS